MLFIVLCTRKLHTLRSFPLWLRFPPWFWMWNLVSLVGHFMNLWILTCVGRGESGVCAQNSLTNSPFSMSLICMHLPICNSVSVCHRFNENISHFFLLVWINEPRVTNRRVWIIPMLFFLRSRENSLQPELLWLKTRPENLRQQMWFIYNSFLLLS